MGFYFLATFEFHFLFLEYPVQFYLSMNNNTLRFGANSNFVEHDLPNLWVVINGTFGAQSVAELYVMNFIYIY